MLKDFAVSGKEARIDMCQALEELYQDGVREDFAVSGKEARIDMCQALEELYQDGVREGREEGREEGVAMIILNMLKSGMSVSDIKKYTGVGESMIAQVQKSMGTLIHK